MGFTDPQHTAQPGPAGDNRPGDGTSDLLIVGIGASTGGLRAVREFFAQTAPGRGIAYLLLMHQGAADPREVFEALQGSSPLPPTYVSEPVPLVPDRVYVLPPDRHATIVNAVIQLEPEHPQEHRAPIDVFFRMLAETFGRNSGAVVLSGKGFDGAIGLQRVKEQGGVTLAQAPEDAEHDSMPRNAISSGLVDFVLPAAAMPAALRDFWQSRAAIRLPAADPADTQRAPGTPSAHDTESLRDIFTLLRLRTGHDFSQYKRATVLRRIGRRMQVHGVTDLAAYLAVLRAQPEEIQALLRDLLISVTNFFRDPEAWDALLAIVPRLFANKGHSDQLRVWVAGCATGEEAYSVAMLLYEHALTLEQPPLIQVFATDIDEDAIAVARQSSYPETIAADVPAGRLQRFFVAEQGRYRIKKEIRDMVLFAPHNLLRDPPFSRLDLITCRNLLIYLNREVQEQVLQLFHFTLRPNGYLLLGASESTDGVPGLFLPVDKGQRLFQRRTVPIAPPPMLPALPMVGAPQRHAPAAPAAGDGNNHSINDLHQILITRHTPPSVIINEDYDVVHLSRGAGRFLQFGEGEPSHNLLKMVHPGLRLELRTALFAAPRKTNNIEIRRLRIELDGTNRLVNLLVQPIESPEWARGYTLVIFNDLGDANEADRTMVEDSEPIVCQLEEELQRTKDQLRATIEQYETAVEEYKAANEELQAINEELRAATEELETSKEELQSVNEEVTTVNQELKHKVDEVSQSNNDLQNLMASTEIGTIFIDRELRIKRYTPSAQKIFNLISSDVNRPIAHITHTLLYDGLVQDAARVLQSLMLISREVQSTDGGWYLARLLPYRTVEDKIDGVILTFVDITERKLAEGALRSSEERFRQISESGMIGIAYFTADGAITEANDAFLKIIRLRREDIPAGRLRWLDLTPPESIEPTARMFDEFRATGKISPDEKEFFRSDGTRFWGLLGGARLDGTAEGVAFLLDITEKIRLQNQRAERRRQQARQEFLRQLVTAQEDERHRIARELHDHFGQQLTALTFGLKALEALNAGQPPALDTIGQLREIAAAIGRDAHQMALDLRPTALDDLGLVAALQSYVEQWGARAGIAADLHMRGMQGRRLPPVLETAIYRVAQEALTNILKHARASHVGLILERNEEYVNLIIEDNGQGFDVETFDRSPGGVPRLGLQGMRERVALVGGTLTIESSAGRGTAMFARIPLHAAVEEHYDDGDHPHPAGR